MATPIYSRFEPIAHLNDFTSKQKDAWHLLMQDIFQSRINGYPEQNDGPRTRFFDPTRTTKLGDFTTATVDWTAFPKQIKNQSSEQRWAKADEKRSLQDEYCEWSVRRNHENKITRVTFTCEPYDYWQFLADGQDSVEGNPQKVLELYQHYVSPEVSREDLFVNGKYQIDNKWNNSTSGSLMHLIHSPNSLFAEIELGAAATIVRKKEGHIVTEQDELIKCSRFGVPTRNSDPTIGIGVNNLARQGAAISFLNPVGLYFAGFQPDAGWETQDDADPQTFWKIERGSDEFPVRATFEVPGNKEYTVSDITINGKPIIYGSQIADYIKIKLTAIAQDLHGQSTIVDGCKKRNAVALNAAVSHVLTSSNASTRSATRVN